MFGWVWYGAIHKLISRLESTLHYYIIGKHFSLAFQKTVFTCFRYGFSDAVNFFRIFGFDCRGFEANLDSCPSPGGNCAADSAPHAVAVRCGGEGEFVPNTGHSANVSYTNCIILLAMI